MEDNLKNDIKQEEFATNSNNEDSTVKEIPVKKPRMLEQDIAKGIGILLVIALHTLTLNRDIYQALGGVFGFIMPFFFFMAGYNHRPYRYKYKEIVKKRCKQILIPFFIYSIAILLIGAIYYMSVKDYTISDVALTYLNLILHSSFSRSVGIRTVSGGLGSCIMSFWFVELLFVSSLIFYAVVDYALEKGTRLLSIVAGLLMVSMTFAHFDFYLPLYLSEAPAITAIMLVGAFFGQKELLSDKTRLLFIILNSIIAYAMFVILALLFKGSGFIAGGMLWDNRIHEWAVLLSFSFAIIGTYPFVHVCRLLVNTGILCKALVWCGTKSMYLLFIHGIVQLYTCVVFKMEPFRMSIFSKTNDFRTFYIFAIEIAVSVLIILLIDLIKKLIKNKKQKKVEA